MVPKGIHVGFAETGDLEVPIEGASPVDLLRPLKGCVVRGAIFFDPTNSLLPTRQNLCPLVLFEDGHVHPTTPTVQPPGHEPSGKSQRKSRRPEKGAAAFVIDVDRKSTRLNSSHLGISY